MASNETTNANKSLLHNHELITDVDHDALSFCDLPMDNDETDLQPFLDTWPTLEEWDDQEDGLFEFATSPDTEHNRTASIVFCGKTIVPRKQPINNDGKRSRSSPSKPSPSLSPLLDSSGSNRPSSFWFGLGGGSHSKPSSPATGGYDRSGPRKQKMEGSEMRKRRQGRRSPARMFSSHGGAGEGKGRSGGGHHHHWGLLRCGAYFMSALTKASFGCLPHV